MNLGLFAIASATLYAVISRVMVGARIAAAKRQEFITAEESESVPTSYPGTYTAPTMLEPFEYPEETIYGRDNGITPMHISAGLQPDGDDYIPLDVPITYDGADALVSASMSGPCGDNAATNDDGYSYDGGIRDIVKGEPHTEDGILDHSIYAIERSHAFHFYNQDHITHEEGYMHSTEGFIPAW